MVRLRAVLAGCLLCVTTAAAQDTIAPEQKSPTVARLLGVLYPGLGHMYAGEVEHGLIVATATTSLVLVGALVSRIECLAESWLSDCGGSTVLTVSLIGAGAIWAWSIFDAGRAAERTNAKRGARTSLILAPVPHDQAAVRLGVRIGTW